MYTSQHWPWHQKSETRTAEFYRGCLHLYVAVLYPSITRQTLCHVIREKRLAMLALHSQLLHSSARRLNSQARLDSWQNQFRYYIQISHLLFANSESIREFLLLIFFLLNVLVIVVFSSTWKMPGRWMCRVSVFWVARWRVHSLLVIFCDVFVREHTMECVLDFLFNI